MKTTEKAAHKPTIMGTTKKLSSSKLEGMVKSKDAAKGNGEVSGKKKKKSKKVKGEKNGTTRATNYKFPKDCVTPKDHKKFRTKVRKEIGDFQDRIALAKSGKSKESEKAVLKEMNDYKSKVYLSPNGKE